MPIFSIVVPVYNTEKYLDECISSILGQSFSDFELILVNDGSTDNSGNICDKYAQSDPRVRVVHTKNQGVVMARKTGVDMAVGEYVTFVDSDDWLDSGFYAPMIEKLEETGADVLICNTLIGDFGPSLTTSLDAGFYDKSALKRYVYPRMMYDTQTNTMGIAPSLWGKLFRTGLLKEAYSTADSRVTLGEDAMCTYPTLFRANSMYIFENTYGYHYRQNQVSMVDQCDMVLLQRVIALSMSLSSSFGAAEKEIKNQVDCHIAYTALYAVQQILLSNKEFCLSERIKKVKEFLENEVIKQAFVTAYDVVSNSKIKLKIKLINQKKITSLKILLSLNAVLLKLKSGKNAGGKK